MSAELPGRKYVSRKKRTSKREGSLTPDQCALVKEGYSMSERDSGESLLHTVKEQLSMYEKVVDLDKRLTLVESCVADLKDLPDIVNALQTTLSDKLSVIAIQLSVSGIQTKITWALLTLVLSSVVGLSFYIIRNGIIVP